MSDKNQKPGQDYSVISQDMAQEFIESFDAMCKVIHSNAVEKGFWDWERNFGEMIALVHSEVSEALEEHRAGEPWDEKIPDFKGVTVELADAIIRIMDLAAGLNMKVGEAIVAKTVYNMKRERLHGKKY